MRVGVHFVMAVSPEQITQYIDGVALTDADIGFDGSWFDGRNIPHGCGAQTFPHSFQENKTAGSFSFMKL